MFKINYSDNTKGPYTPHKGSSYNAKCPSCGKPTWYCENPWMTRCYGQKMMDYNKKVVGVLDLKGNVYCEECFPDKEMMV